MPKLRASGVAFALVAILCTWTASVRADEPEAQLHADQLAKKLHAVVQAKKVPQNLWIETIDGERPDPPDMIVYGSGVGVWARTRQFHFTEKQMLKALKLLDRAGFASMPDRVKGPKPAHIEEGGEPDSTMIVRAVTLTIGGLSKTVIQDNKAWKLESFEKLREKLVKIFRKAARQGIEASSLDDGLAKVASGELAPEVLQVLVNAPQQRGLRSQEGQGWVLRVDHGLDRGRASQPRDRLRPFGHPPDHPRAGPGDRCMAAGGGLPRHAAERLRRGLHRPRGDRAWPRERHPGAGVRGP